MVQLAVGKARSVPSTYSQCMNSLVRRPLALVNAGFSLKLAENARQNQSMVGHQHNQPDPITLLLVEGPQQYEFAVKLGDRQRAHDGLVGYFKPSKSPYLNDKLNLSKIYTPLLDTKAGDETWVKPITRKRLLWLKPFWLDPAAERIDDDDDAARKYIRA
ncbi:uncharacterized protein Aud_002058 [Aspergillus udagawae]|uniref:Uncharacterized protein n=1 Tax=Aspergillus udagawae TaxID=91492 RepID=A0A8E0R3R7_9EURO|nr:uncharacterized protein Aud_002058 [Aspergillus udagawae]GIC94729.1 hypothetical protein Aud_002058 [Aspergillus udagawae]